MCPRFPQHLFGEVEDLPRNADPYQPAGMHGWDPSSTLGPTASLRMHLLKLLTSTAFNAKHVAGNLLFAACAEDAEEFACLCGLGSAAGLLVKAAEGGHTEMAAFLIARGVSVNEDRDASSCRCKPLRSHAGYGRT